MIDIWQKMFPHTHVDSGMLVKAIYFTDDLKRSRASMARINSETAI
ncbi:MAG TPA: hypothetical protein VGD98_01990 [Ktedonobacteraceae bacterium]